MKNFFKILVALIIFTTSINAEEGHEGHDSVDIKERRSSGCE